MARKTRYEEEAEQEEQPEALQKGYRHFNSITLSDLQVQSTTSSLGQVKEVIDKLIKEHSDFIFERRKKALLDNLGQNYTG